MSFPPIPVQLILVALVVTALVLDLRSRRIPNWLSVSGFLAGLTMSFYLQSWGGLRHLRRQSWQCEESVQIAPLCLSKFDLGHMA